MFSIYVEFLRLHFPHNLNIVNKWFDEMLFFGLSFTISFVAVGHCSFGTPSCALMPLV